MENLRGLIILCNGCGQPMMDHGEWPVAYPKPTQPITYNTQTANCYSCKTCRTPHNEYAPGIPVRISIINPPEDD